MMKDEVINVDGTNWLVREAVSEEAARNTIAHARVTGSIGGKDALNGKTTADVVRLNPDNTECLPYGEKGGTDHSELVELANNWLSRLTRAMGRDLSAEETARAQELRGKGELVAMIARKLREEAPATVPTPEYIMRRLRQRNEVQADDHSHDAELSALPPLEKLRHVAAWELGSPDWADQFITWAKACGIQITDPRD